MFVINKKIEKLDDDEKLGEFYNDISTQVAAKEKNIGEVTGGWRVTRYMIEWY